MTGFSESTENQNATANSLLITMSYVGMLRREPDATGYAWWLGEVNAGPPEGAGLDQRLLELSGIRPPLLGFSFVSVRQTAALGSDQGGCFWGMYLLYEVLLLQYASYMNFTLRIPLETSPEQVQRLQALQHGFAQVCNALATVVQQTCVESGSAAPLDLPAVARAVSADGLTDGVQRDLFRVAHLSGGVSASAQSVPSLASGGKSLPLLRLCGFFVRSF